MDFSYLTSTKTSSADYTDKIAGKGSVANFDIDSYAKKTTVNGVIKNILSSDYNTEKEINSMKTTKPGTIQSSALILNGANVSKYLSNNPVDYMSYVYKKMDQNFTSYGTRMRIIGEVSNEQSKDKLYQNPSGANPFYETVGAASGGIAVSVNPKTNFGYYFEIAALTEANVNNYSGQDINNVFFYKLGKGSETKAIPKVLWSGLTQIVVDDGNFTGQSRQVGEQYTTVYDLAIEYERFDLKCLRFYLYINDKLIAIVEDKDPLIKNNRANAYNSFALFTRANSKIMFENVHALGSNSSRNPDFELNAPINSVFGGKSLNTNSAFKKFSISGVTNSKLL
jgi:hypothetical protein